MVPGLVQHWINIRSQWPYFQCFTNIGCQCWPNVAKIAISANVEPMLEQRWQPMVILPVMYQSWCNVGVMLEANANLSMVG